MEGLMVPRLGWGPWPTLLPLPLETTPAAPLPDTAVSLAVAEPPSLTTIPCLEHP